MQSTKQSVGSIIIENLGAERGLRQSHALSLYMALTSENVAATGGNTRLQLSVDKLYGILYGRQKRKMLCCVHNK